MQSAQVYLHSVVLLAFKGYVHTMQTLDLGMFLFISISSVLRPTKLSGLQHFEGQILTGHCAVKLSHDIEYTPELQCE